MNTKAEIFNEIVEERRSIRIYDAQFPFDESAVTRSLERALLSPNSSNLQLWEFYRVKTKSKKEELVTYCLGQKSAKTANELIVIVTRKDKWKKHANFILKEAMNDFPDKLEKKHHLIMNYYKKLIPALYYSDVADISGKLKKIAADFSGTFKPIPREVTATDVRIVVHKSAALAAQTFMLSMKAEGYDSCPMEGYDSERVKKFLKLPKAAEINMIISVGKAKPEGIYGKRVRVPKNEVLFEI
ncbi:MAG TPA: nitroreductase family protein [Chitinophagales bacterium]|jgi:nitroreductase|nr:nitroreductase family protein [Chitinophagales bacterium]HQW78491.1 nitroreductase family protein [Chitinophagales bacterium]HRB20006.1 nitroreductase family protein [Chitinophagales bacterium]HRB67292.1 nitroreductase family protein [Chitinophagales bacterium]